jgi:hypothetical protein
MKVPPEKGRARGGRQMETDDIATVYESDQFAAHAEGRDHPDREWILSDRDCWYRNPFFRGVPGPHPEDP